jgi:hypothetical protein
MPRGGYRAPTNPAAVSGPGQFARRTDGQPVMDMPDAAYGENAAFREIQSGAQVAGAQGIPSSSGGGGATSTPLGLGAPSTMLDVPVTAGAAAGAGPGPEALGLPQSPREINQADARVLRKQLPAMLIAASRPGATQSFKDLVRALVQNLQ